MTDKIIISRKELDALKTYDCVTQDNDMGVGMRNVIAGKFITVSDLCALLDKAEGVSEPIGELVALPIYNETGIAGWDAEVRLDIYFTFEAGMQGAKVYTTPQPSRISELEAEIARLKAIT